MNEHETEMQDKIGMRGTQKLSAKNRKKMQTNQIQNHMNGV